jgi:hypothetical protein
MADLFGRRSLEFGGAFSADAAQIAFSFSNPTQRGLVERGGVGLLTQQLNFSYAQQITRLYEIGSQRTFFVAGRPQGNAQMARVVGPREVTMAFYYKFGNVCCAKDNVLQFRAAAMCLPTGMGTTTEETVALLSRDPKQQQITALGAAASTGAISLRMTGVVITTVGFTVQAENMVINEQVQLMYVALETDDTSQASAYSCGAYVTPQFTVENTTLENVKVGSQ